MIYAVVELLDEQTVEEVPGSWIKNIWKVIVNMHLLLCCILK